MTEETLFADALAIPDAAARAAFLERACPDPVQRQRVAELLAAVGGTNPLDRRWTFASAWLKRAMGD